MSRSRPPDDTAPTVACPHCDSTDVEVLAPFGGNLMSRQYWCRGCRTVFEWVKWEPADPAEWLDGDAREA